MLPGLGQVSDHNVRVIRDLFVRRENDLKTRYGKFCINKPKSEYIMNEFSAYFSVSEYNLSIHCDPRS